MSDYEIEYLDEDEDVVQQCVEMIDYTSLELEEQPLLVRRTMSTDKKVRKRKTRKSSSESEVDKFSNTEHVQEIDSDYDPVEEERKQRRPKRVRRPTQHYQTIQPPVKLPTGPKSSKTTIKPFKPNKPKPDSFECKIPIKEIRLTRRKKGTKQGKAKLKMLQNLKQKKKIGLNTEKLISTLKSDHLTKMQDVKLYDFEDAKCFNGIRLLKSGELVTKWNQLCLKQESEMTDAKSCRSVQYLRKVRTNVDGVNKNVIRLHYECRVDGKHYNFQGILPPFRPLKEVDISFVDQVHAKGDSYTLTTIVTQETDKLVAYCARDYRVMIFDGSRGLSECTDEVSMLLSCKMCVECYQYSWRGGKNEKDNADINCVVCASNFTSVYNLLSHIRNHKLTKEDKVKQNAMFSKLMGYHYNCRLCQFKAKSIPELRKHLKYHKSCTPFFCEVGKHFTK